MFGHWCLLVVVPVALWELLVLGVVLVLVPVELVELVELVPLAAAAIAAPPPAVAPVSASTASTRESRFRIRFTSFRRPARSGLSGRSSQEVGRTSDRPKNP